MISQKIYKYLAQLNNLYNLTNFQLLVFNSNLLLYLNNDYNLFFIDFL